MNESIYVARPVLPDISRYSELVEQILSSGYLTNNGSSVQNLEKQIASFLDVPFVIACANGTLSLQLAIRHLGMAGKKVITTPFSYVASLSALLWEGCEPIFADIDTDTLTMNLEETEALLKAVPGIAGILPVHVFGNAADVDGLDTLAKRHGAKVLYDGAHSFGSRLDGNSLLSYGDLSICSFHATKLFHTVEGGCIVCDNARDAEKLRLLRSFGHRGDEHYCLGINAKMSELHAAMGLCLLPRAREFIKKRKSRTEFYDKLLSPDNSGRWRGIKFARGLEWNYSYYPLIFNNEAATHKVLDALARENIFPRRYFYPSLNNLPYIKKQVCPVSEDIAKRIICLPLWEDMEKGLIAKICRIMLENCEI